MLRPRPARWLLAACLFLPTAALSAADDAPAPAPAPAPRPDAPKPAANRSHPLSAKDRADVLPLMHAYLEPDSDQALRHRQRLLEKVKGLEAAGTDLLLDLDTLSSVIYGSRTFHPPFSKRSLPKGAEVRESETAAQQLTSVVWEKLRLTLSHPRTYPVGDPKKEVEHAPWPMIVTLHEPEDFQDAKGVQPWPGERVLERRYDPSGPMKPVLEEWFVLAPVTTKARWTNEEGRIFAETVRDPLMNVWQRYNVDFDRIVIDGGSEALAFAAAHTLYYAGVIVRGDKADVAPDLVRNFAHLSVYVVGTPKSAALKSLKDGGFPPERVKVGGVEGLPEWLKGVRRTLPRSFRWTMKDRATMPLANWVNVNNFDDGPAPVLEVEVVDTKEDPNTVRLRSRGVRGVTLFLSDRVVDLDRPVRIVANGVPVPAAILGSAGDDEKPLRLPATLPRSFDTALDARNLSPRKSMYFGWLFPVRLDDVRVVGDDAELSAPPAGPETKPPEVTPPPEPAMEEAPTAGVSEKEQAERNAVLYVEKAEEAEREGRLDRAKSLYAKAIAEGETSVRAKAQAKLKELESREAPKGSPVTR